MEVAQQTKKIKKERKKKERRNEMKKERLENLGVHLSATQKMEDSFDRNLVNEPDL